MMRGVASAAVRRRLAAPAGRRVRGLSGIVSTAPFRPEAEEAAERAAAAARQRQREQEREQERERRRRRAGFFKRLFRVGVLGSAAAAAYAAYLREHVAQPEDGLTWQRLFVETMPTRALSRAWGAVNDVTLPVALREPLYRLWTWKYGCKLDEAELPLEEYENLQAFFTRRLKAGARVPQSGDLVSSADSHLLVAGEMTPDGRIEQVKGVTYRAADLLGHEPRPIRGGKMHYAVMYLAPGDYHHFHSPADMVVRETVHVAGEMMPVAPELVRVVPGLFGLNERVVVSGEWKHGVIDVVPVAAYNVGNISIAFDPEVRTNAREQDAAVRERKALLFRDVLPASGREAVEKAEAFVRGASDTARSWMSTSGEAPPLPPTYLSRRVYPDGGVRLRKGDDLGCFHLGSTVVVVFEAPEGFRFRADPGFDVTVGQNLGTVAGASK